MVNSRLLDYLSSNCIKYISPIKTADLVSFRVGNIGKIAVFPKNIQELCEILSIVKNEKFVVIGNGTNCYFTDNLYDGVIIVTTKINDVSYLNDGVVAECGASINTVCKVACANSLEGLEFAYGIPGTVGGCVRMNASAFGGCMADVVLSSTVLDVKSGEIYDLCREEHFFDKKSSIFKNSSLVLLNTKFSLPLGDKMEIKSKMDLNFQKRKDSQPLDFHSAGCVFVKPKDSYASYLIDKAGLKGFSVGNAQVSTKHAGFIVNRGNALSKDVNELILHIKKTVFDMFSVELEKEIIYLE